MKSLKSIRAVSAFEATKGAVALLAGFGILSLIHHDVQKTAEQIVCFLHLNPAKYYPHIFIDTASNLKNSNLWLMSILALGYAAMRFIEAFGLWFGMHWAEWFSAVSGSIYIPFEIYEISHRITFISLSTFVVNLFIVGIMINVLRTRKSETTVK